MKNRFISFLLLLPFFVLMMSCKSGTKTSETTNDSTAFKGQTLNILCWEGYADPLFTKGFEQKYGVIVKGTYFGSSDELVSKLQGGGDASYDILSPSSDV